MKSNTEQYDQDTSGNLQVRAVESKEALAEPKLKKFTNRRTAAAYKYLTQAVEEKERPLDKIYRAPSKWSCDGVILSLSVFDII